MVRHEARLAEKQKDGKPYRLHLERAAAQGVDRAVRALEGPPMPEALQYLHNWLYELHGRSGVDLGGLSPLTYGTIAAWAQLTDRAPQPHDVQALLMLDLILRAPTTGEE